MKINTQAVLKNLDGVELQMPQVNGSPSLPLTLRRACVEALMIPREADTGEQKVKKWDIATRLYNADECELTPEEVSIIKQAVGQWGGPMIVGQAFHLLNG